ncbi:trypsin-1 [Culex quinquefasciatus]|uniref:Trypsin-1 n=1 Tax=Culex quinquefasciatus TaxID=7176 RepID=B0WZE8_CULQU|nr:trypsin-1 [Culex quinquefasciatus]|eukprot:XP_001862770.1 trypsin-1 [Culex quinquefasciatus]
MAKLVTKSLLLLFFLLASASSFVIPDEEPEQFMIGGTPTVQGAFPAVAFIRTIGRPICGAAVIDERHVVTLAQCVLNGTFHLYNPRLVRVHTGDILLNPVSPTRETRLASVIYVHPNFKAHTYENDIAVIRLQEPLPLPSNEIEPAFRRTRIVGNGFTCHMVGWGQTAATGQVVDVQQRSIPTVINDRDQCNFVRHLSPVTESMICAGNLVAAATGPAPCTGNIGSGLYCDGDLTGLLSFGLNCGTANNPPTFTQIRFFNGWIEQQLVRTDVPPAGWSPLDV